MGQAHLHTDTESPQHAQMHWEENSNTNSVGCVLCGSCGESVTYLFPLKMIFPLPSPTFFVLWVRDEGAEVKRLKPFFYRPCGGMGGVLRGQSFHRMLSLLHYLWPCALPLSECAPFTAANCHPECVSVCACACARGCGSVCGGWVCGGGSR